ncbi:MAG: hypothetical protein QGG36_14095, partial [Pirellulaceae bacterium]|nr:hypothetical protein [Pirellulaceae bacterium]
MAQMNCFLKTTPSKILTSSLQNVPCPVAPCTLQEMCGQYSRPPGTLPFMLRFTYSEAIRNSLSQESSSVVVRSEQQFHGRDVNRLAIRKHFYEVFGGGNAATIGTSCEPTPPSMELGEYLGFVDLRLEFKRSPLALGCLVEPGVIRQNADSYVIKGEYASLFGATPFRSTVYCMQDPDTAGAMCAQACVVMVSAMLADRRAKIMGSLTLSYLGRTINQVVDPEDKLETEGIKGFFEIGGLSEAQGSDQGQIVDVLDQCGVSARLLRIEDEPTVAGAAVNKKPGSRAARIIEAYLRARYPIILLLDSNRWEESLMGAHSGKDEKHAVVIVGEHRRSDELVPDDYYIHDPGSAPFIKLRFSDCMRCSSAAFDANPKSDEIFNFIACAEDTIRIHADECLRDFEESTQNSSSRQLVKNNFGSDGLHRWRMRMFHRTSVLREIIDPFFHSIQVRGNKIQAGSKFLDADQYWVILFKEVDRTIAFLYDASSPIPRPSGVVKAGPGANGLSVSLLLPEGRRYTFDKDTGWTRSSGDGDLQVKVKVDRPHTGDEKPRKRRVFDPSMDVGLISSCSNLPMPDLARAVAAIGVDRIDPILFREIDLPRLASPPTRMAQYLDKTRLNATQQAVLYWRSAPKIKIPALATYFPYISSPNVILRDEAIDAIVNCTNLRMPTEWEWTSKPDRIVEVVCGNILGRDANRVIVYDRESMIQRLLKALVKVVERCSDNRYFFALELEPGETYVLNDMRSLWRIAELLESNEFPTLKNRVGFNLDIAHMRIAGVPANRAQADFSANVLGQLQPPFDDPEAIAAVARRNGIPQLVLRTWVDQFVVDNQIVV